MNRFDIYEDKKGKKELTLSDKEESYMSSQQTHDTFSTLEIFVKTSKGNVFKLEIEKSDKVSSLVDVLAKNPAQRYDFFKHRFYCNGCYLEWEDTFGDCDIKGGDVVSHFGAVRGENFT